MKLYLKLFVTQPPNCLKTQISDSRLVIINRKFEYCVTGKPDPNSCPVMLNMKFVYCVKLYNLFFLGTLY